MKRRIVLPLVVLALLWFVSGCTNPEPCQCEANQVCKNNQCVPSGAGEAGKAEEVSRDAAVPELFEPVAETPPRDEPVVKAYRWRSAPSGTTKDLHAVAMPSANNAWAVGNGGTILASKDGGLTWSRQTSGTSADLKGVWFNNDKEGWVVGAEGTVLRTENGGKTWQTLASPTKSMLTGVQFFNKSQGVVVGKDFTFMTTSSGGDNWQSTSKSAQLDLIAVWFSSLQRGIAVGSKGTILYTTDAGQQLTNALTGTDKSFYGIHLIDEKNGFAVGEGGTILRTEDGGQGWTAVDLRKFPVDLYGLWFVSKTRGWMVGKDGLLLGSNDGGKTWRSETSETLPTFYGIRMFSRNAGVIVGAKGTIVTMQAVAAECSEGDSRECYSGPKGTKGVGVCKGGTQVCKEGLWGACEGQRLPAAKEICFNGDDDNCNAKPDKDDGCPACQVGDVKPCYTGASGTQGTGECRAGEQRCTTNNDWGKCEKQVVPGKEVCDGKDNDCDGAVDEEIKQEDLPDCDNSYGVCKGKKKLCKSGKPVACTAKEFGTDYQAKEDKCDKKDNDCDGVVDEGCPCQAGTPAVSCYTGPGGTAGVGTCKQGKQTCSNGKLTDCVGQVKPVREICADKQDNNCNGATDEVNQWGLNFDSRRRAHVLIKDNPALRPTAGMTVEGHFYPRNLGSRARSYVSRAQSGGYSLMIDSPKKGDLSGRVWLKGGSAYTYVTVKHKGLLKNDTWFHIAFTYDGSMLRLFVNGKKVGVKEAKGSIYYPPNKPVALIFGAEPGNDNKVDARAANYVYGRIAEVRLSGKSLYDKDFTPPCAMAATSDTIGFWQLDEGSGAKTVKASNGKYEGEIKSATWMELIRCKGFAKGGCVSPKP